MASNKKHDWNAIMNDYITDPASSLRKIAKKWEVPESLVREHSKRDGWNNAKKKQQEKIRKKAAAKLATKSANKLARELEAAELAGKVALKALSDPEQYYRHLVTTTKGKSVTTEERIYGKMDARALKETLQSLRMVEDLKRSIGEIQRQSERQKHDIEQARLELERARLDLERERLALQKQREGSGVESGNYGVVELPPVLEQEPPAELLEEEGEPDE